jgi:hypothetical protein
MKKKLTVSDRIVKQTLLHNNILFYTKIGMGLTVLGCAVFLMVFNR